MIFTKKMAVCGAVLLGAVSSLAISTPANAASFEEMKTNVENGTGVVFNPKLNRDMTQEEGMRYIAVIENAQKLLSTDLVTPEMQEKAFSMFDTENKHDKEIASIDDMLKAASIPNTTSDRYNLTGSTYTSDKFSGDGWRYSGYSFFFKDYTGNPYFGVRVNYDTMNFVLRDNTVTVSTNAVNNDGSFHYYANNGRYNGYFSTYNPVVGSYYEIN
jgi:hypothetical protein